MASTSAAPELAQALPPTLPAPSLRGRVRVFGLRAAAAVHRTGVDRYGWPIAIGASSVGAFVLSAVAHELVAALFAVALASITGLPVLQDLLAALPVNFIYASAMLRYAGQIEVSGLAVAGAPGLFLADRLAGVFYDPSFVAGDGLVSAVLAPGSSQLARMLVSTLANATVLTVGLIVARFALDGAGARSLAHLRGRRLLLLGAGVATQVEVAARVVRAPGGTRDLETLGVLPFVLHEILRLHRDVYDVVMFQLSRWLDPVFAELVLLVLLAVLAAGYGVARLVRRPGRPTWSTRRRLVAESAMVAVLVATLPPFDAVGSSSRFLEMETLGASAPQASSEMGRESLTSSGLEMVPPPVAAADLVPLPVAPPAADALQPSTTPGALAGASISLPPLVHGSRVAVGGRGGSFTYVVDGVPTEFRGMGYNVTYAGLPPSERVERLRRDFQAMRAVGVNVVVGWRTAEWDETVLNAAQAAGIGVVMPFDLDDSLDYSDRAVRWKVRSDVLAWVARYRGHPAIRMWGIGNESLLHLRVAARARAFADFYTQTVELVRQLDPDHPVLYREAEDVYVRWLQEAWQPRGGPPPGFVLGMNFYTFRMKDALAAWPNKGMDVPIVISEFAPGSIGRDERAAGYWKMWNIIRQRPQLVLGAAPYVWNAEGPEPVDRLFGLTVDAKPVDSTLGTLRDMYALSAAPKDPAAPLTVPSLVGMPADMASRAIANVGLRLGSVAYQRAAELKDPTPVRRYGVGNVIHQEPAPGTPIARGGEVRLAVADGPLEPEVRGRPVAD